MPIREKALVARCVGGEPDAWDALVAAHGPRLREVIAGTLSRFGAFPDPQSVQDVLQEVWLCLLKDRSAMLRRYDWRHPLGRLLAAVAVNRAVDHLRSRRRPLSLDCPLGTGDPWPEMMPGTAGTPVDEAESAEHAACLREALGELTLREQAILRLFYWEGATTEEIGRALQQRTGTIRSLLSRGREKLRKIWNSRSSVPPGPAQGV